MHEHMAQNEQLLPSRDKNQNTFRSLESALEGINQSHERVDYIVEWIKNDCSSSSVMQLQEILQLQNHVNIIEAWAEKFIGEIDFDSFNTNILQHFHNQGIKNVLAKCWAEKNSFDYATLIKLYPFILQQYDAAEIVANWIRKNDISLNFYKENILTLTAGNILKANISNAFITNFLTKQGANTNLEIFERDILPLSHSDYIEQIVVFWFDKFCNNPDVEISIDQLNKILSFVTGDDKTDIAQKWITSTENISIQYSRFMEVLNCIEFLKEPKQRDELTKWTKYTHNPLSSYEPSHSTEEKQQDEPKIAALKTHFTQQLLDAPNISTEGIKLAIHTKRLKRSEKEGKEINAVLVNPGDKEEVAKFLKNAMQSPPGDYFALLYDDIHASVLMLRKNENSNIPQFFHVDSLPSYPSRYKIFDSIDSAIKHGTLGNMEEMPLIYANITQQQATNYCILNALENLFKLSKAPDNLFYVLNKKSEIVINGILALSEINFQTNAESKEANLLILTTKFLCGVKTKYCEIIPTDLPLYLLTPMQSISRADLVKKHFLLPGELEANTGQDEHNPAISLPFDLYVNQYTVQNASGDKQSLVLTHKQQELAVKMEKMFAGITSVPEFLGILDQYSIASIKENKENKNQTTTDEQIVPRSHSYSLSDRAQASEMERSR